MSFRVSRVILSTLVAIAAVAGAATVRAQQASAYTNPLDSGSDISSWSYYDGYPYYPQIDTTPVEGHSGASLNANNGNGTIDDDYWFYWYGESDMINLSGMTSPVFSFWCRNDTGNPDYWDHYIQLYDANWWYAFYYSLGQNGDLNCGSSGDWHQHTIQLDPYIVSSGGLRVYFYCSMEFYSGQNSGLEGWFMDHFQILVDDETPPDAITDLAASNPTQTQIQLNWSSPNDDDVSGVVASFDLRYSTSPITEGNFATALTVTGEPAPNVAGSPHGVLVIGLSPETTYYFAVRSTDKGGNASLISNVVSLDTLAPPPPPPPPPPIASSVLGEEAHDDILPCAAGAASAPTGLLALAGLVLLAFVLRRNA